MGCVIGKRVTGEGSRSSRDNEKKGGVGSTAVTVPAKNGKIEEVPPEFHLKRGVSFNGDNWPSWLIEVAGDAIKNWKPRRANTFEKLDKIGQGTYSNVYKVRDLINGKVMALKKVRFDNLEPETVRFMAREILILTKLNHPNVIKLEGLVISRMSSSLYLIFEYMEHDLSGLAALQSDKFTEPQVKCYMKQLLAGLEHCHKNGVLHRDIKCSNLLIDNEGNLKIADFGLATCFDSQHKRPMTSRVVTLWYRPPELLLGASYYDTGVDLWSAGCILAELLAGKPILRGRTEVEQLHKIFKLCGSPSEEFWKKSKLPNATVYKPQQPHKCCIIETYKDFPQSALSLIGTLLAVDPDSRGTATSALNSDYFTTEPAPCEPSDLPKFPPSKEMDIKLRDEETRKQRGGVPKPQVAEANHRERTRSKVVSRAMPVPEANAELQVNLDIEIHVGHENQEQKREISSAARRRSRWAPLDPSENGVASFSTASSSFSSFIFDPKSSLSLRRSSSKSGASRRRNTKADDDHQKAPARSAVTGFYSSSGWDFLLRRRGASVKFG